MPDVTTLHGHLSNVLRSAGLGAEQVAPHNLLIDLSPIEHMRRAPARSEALETTAGLILRLAQAGETVRAVLPRNHAGQRQLATTGVLFALAQSGAALAVPADDAADQLTFVDAGQYRALQSDVTWRRDFLPEDPDFRDQVISEQAARVRLARRAARTLGITDERFVALVNPHLVPAADILGESERVLSPWLSRVAKVSIASGSFDVSHVLDVLAEALENVALHAFPGTAYEARSLVILEEFNDHLRLQIQDNGVGIPRSLANKLSMIDVTAGEAQRLVGDAVNSLNEWKLPGGRGEGLPHMRKLAAAADAKLRITTAGPHQTRVVVECAGSAPAMAYSDLVPIAGTVVTMVVPLTS